LKKVTSDAFGENDEHFLPLLLKTSLLELKLRGQHERLLDERQKMWQRAKTEVGERINELADHYKERRHELSTDFQALSEELRGLTLSAKASEIATKAAQVVSKSLEREGETKVRMRHCRGSFQVVILIKLGQARLTGGQGELAQIDQTGWNQK